MAERVSFFATVSFRTRDNDPWRFGFSYDLSSRGLFVSTLTPLPSGARVTLRVAFPGKQTLECMGTVAWANSRSQRKSYSYTVGMGVQFAGGDPAFERTLAGYTSVSRGGGVRA